MPYLTVNSTEIAINIFVFVLKGIQLQVAAVSLTALTASMVVFAYRSFFPLEHIKNFIEG